MITKEAIEAGCAAIAERRGFKWPSAFSEEELAVGRENIELAITAAFAAMPGPAVKVKPLGRAFEEAIFSDVETLYEATTLTPAPDLAAENEMLRAALENISSPSQTTGLLWWQVEARATGRREGMESMISWHAKEIARLDEQIAENNAYRVRVGNTAVSMANEYCSLRREVHEQSIAAIRAAMENA